MIAKCEICGQVKNLIKGQCDLCYHREKARKKAQAKKAKAIVCIKCGTQLRNRDYDVCVHCRNLRQNYESRLQGLFKKIETTEDYISICKLVESGVEGIKIAEQRGVTKQAISLITTKGLDFYENKLKDLKAKFFDLSQKIKEFDKDLEEKRTKKVKTV